MSDFSTFSQMTYCSNVSPFISTSTMVLRPAMLRSREGERTYGDAVRVLGADALSFRLALLERVLVLELGTHGDFVRGC